MLKPPTAEESIRLMAEDQIVAASDSEKSELLNELSDRQRGAMFDFMVAALTDWNPQSGDMDSHAYREMYATEGLHSIRAMIEENILRGLAERERQRVAVFGAEA